MFNLDYFYFLEKKSYFKTISSIEEFYEGMQDFFQLFKVIKVAILFIFMDGLILLNIKAH
jgi:hypothetical protein